MIERVGRQARRGLRPPGSDDLGLRRALSDRLLPMLVGAMAFLAALALAGVVAAAALSQHWERGAAAALTVQVPEPEMEGRLTRVLEVVRGTPGVLSARALGDAELQALLKPWLGSGAGRIALPLPAVVAVRFAGAGFDSVGLGARLQTVAAGTLVEAQDVWVRRLSVLARSLQACAALAMGVVGFVAVAVVTVATRAGLSARRDAIEIVHGLGATDGFIAGRFARRATRLTVVGAAAGALVALPVLVGLTGLAAPFVNDGGEAEAAPDLAGVLAVMPGVIWLGLPALPVIAAAIGWVTAQATVRRLAAAVAMIRWPGWLAGLALLLGAVWGGGFGVFERAARQGTEEQAGVAPVADGVVALTGGADRVDTALALLAAGRAPLLLISGVGQRAELAELARRVRLSPDEVARVTLGREATSTSGNAEETAAWARAHGLRSLLVVTAGYHMPRALVEIGRALPGVKLYPVPVQPPALRGGVEAATVRMLANEFDKFLAVSVGWTHLRPGRADMAREEAGGS